jgi:hypothetical protein
MNLNCQHIFLSLLTFILVAGCSSQEVTVEILPPRTSSTCSAPAISSGALASGLWDVKASQLGIGEYVSDLRFQLNGADAVVEGIALEITTEEDVSDDIQRALKTAAGEWRVGNAVLAGEDDEQRVAILENVTFMNRNVAEAFVEDADLNLENGNTLALKVMITPLVSDNQKAVSTSFILNICKGCLVDAPTEEVCPLGVQLQDVCRIGQDVPSYRCAKTQTTAQQPAS